MKQLSRQKPGLIKLDIALVYAMDEERTSRPFGSGGIRVANNEVGATDQPMN